MKKGILIIFSVFVFCSFSFGQSSRTSTSSVSLFKNDTDNFMNVNAWQSVKPENFFGTLYYGNGLNLGAAKQFDDFYLGLYGNGKLTDFTRENDKAGKTTHTEIDDTGYFNLSALVGLKDIGGIKAFVSFKPYNLDNQSDKSDAGTITQNNYDFTTTLSYGFNTEKDGKKLSPHFSISLTDTKRKTTNTIADTLTDNSYADLSLSGGTGIVYPAKGIFEHSLDLSGSAAFRFYPSETSKDYTEKGRSRFYASFTPVYLCEIKPAEKLSIKFRTSLPMSLETTATASEINGSSVDDSLRTKTLSLNVIPDVRLGAQYVLKPSFIMNAGTSFSMGNLQYESSKKGEDKTGKWTFTDNSRTLFTYSGFEWKPMGGKLSLDCYYDIIWDIFNNDLKTDFTQGSTDIWENVNMALIHNVTIGLSVKF